MDVVWGTSQTVTLAEGVAHVFVDVDHCNSECVGIHKSANRFQALEPVRQSVRQHFGAIGKDVAAGLKLRYDHGSNVSVRPAPLPRWPDDCWVRRPLPGWRDRSNARAGVRRGG